MSWLHFILGFLAFPVLGLAVLLLARVLSQTRPVEVVSAQDLQAELRGLLDNGKHGETLFIVWLPLRFHLHVSKRTRKTKAGTLWLELRNSDANRGHYEAVRSALESGGLDFEESFTPALRRPRRLRIVWPTGGPVVVSAASHAISLVQSALPSEGAAKRLASRDHPDLWRGGGAAAA